MKLYVEVLQGPLMGKMFFFENPKEVIIGRSPTVDVPLPDDRVSRQHCKIQVLPQGVYVVDLNSRNGLYHRKRDKRIQSARLVSGDILFLGQSNSVRIHLERSKGEALDFCQSCGHTVKLPVYPNGEVVEVGGQVLCPNCAPKLDISPHQIPGYQIVKKVGEGAVGKVYQALRLKDRTKVALKLLRLDQNLDPKVTKRFQREALAEDKLRHPNIVQLYEFGTSPPYHYLAMEFVDGATLLDIIIEHGPMEPSMALNVGIKVCRALEHAHKSGIVHRDIKPSNIMISQRGEVKLTDFGLAKHMEDTGISVLTTTGTGIGTPAYMSPEQVINARAVDIRADIYSLGVTLYVALTGYRPFSAKSTHEYLRLILSASPIPIRKLKPSVPEILAKTVEKAMAKKPEKRYQNPTEFLRALIECGREMAGK